MGMLGKDLFDIYRPLTHTKVEFGETAYWVEDRQKDIPYGTVLTELMDCDISGYKKSLSRLRETDPGKNDHIKLLNQAKRELSRLPFYRYYLRDRNSFSGDPEADFYFRIEEDLELIRNRYRWFLEEIQKKAEPEKKKGSKKLTPAELVYQGGVEPFVTGVSLGQSSEPDPPPVQVQYVMRNAMDSKLSTELVERMYFDRLVDFVYVEMMKGIQKGFLSKKCPNCGKWFLQEPGTTYSYCARPLETDPSQTCRDVGSVKSFQIKTRNNTVWLYHQRAYKKYFARTKKQLMTQTEFEAWSSEAAKLRDEALAEYERSRTEEERKAIAEKLKEAINKA